MRIQSIRVFITDIPGQDQVDGNEINDLLAKGEIPVEYTELNINLIFLLWMNVLCDDSY